MKEVPQCLVCLKTLIIGIFSPKGSGTGVPLKCS